MSKPFTGAEIRQMFIQYFQLQGTQLSQGVIDVVEGGVEDVALLEPESAAVEEIVVLVVFVGEVDLFEFAELGFTLRRRQVGVGVDFMLEVIDEDPIRDKGHG